MNVLKSQTCSFLKHKCRKQKKNLWIINQRPHLYERNLVYLRLMRSSVCVYMYAPPLFNMQVTGMHCVFMCVCVYMHAFICFFPPLWLSFSSVPPCSCVIFDVMFCWGYNRINLKNPINLLHQIFHEFEAFEHTHTHTCTCTQTHTPTQTRKFAVIHTEWRECKVKPGTVIKTIYIWKLGFLEDTWNQNNAEFSIRICPFKL